MSRAQSNAYAMFRISIRMIPKKGRWYGPDAMVRYGYKDIASAYRYNGKWRVFGYKSPHSIAPIPFRDTSYRNLKALRIAFASEYYRALTPTPNQ